MLAINDVDRYVNGSLHASVLLTLGRCQLDLGLHADAERRLVESLQHAAKALAPAARGRGI